MIFANGRLYDATERDRILTGLEAEINRTRETCTLTPDTVINALCGLADKAKSGAYNGIIASLGIPNAGKYLDTAIAMLSRQSLEYKIKNELGDDLPGSSKTMPALNGKKISCTVYPLGTLFHIAAGNVDGLPAYSLAEGLLCGNVNILKLPMADNNLSVLLIEELVKQEPRLAPFIYVFDTPSEDITTMKKLAEMCDGIVLWGGEAAEIAVRKMAPTGTKLIEWGHKLSFAYVSGFRGCQGELAALAEHIISTKQLLCSSCQNILVDTASQAELEEFCAAFFPYLKAAAQKEAALAQSIGDRAQKSLERYTKKLERIMGVAEETGRFSDENCSVSISGTQHLELSPMFGNMIVKGVPRKGLLSVLRSSKGVLQTAGLICPEEEREPLAKLLFASGITKVTRAGTMSEAFIGESHDGEFPLRRYVRIVCNEE